MSGDNFKFVNITPYAPEQFNILDENDKLIALLYTRCGRSEVYPYINDDIQWNNKIYDLNYNDQYLGSIPDNMRDDVFDSIKFKLKKYLKK